MTITIYTPAEAAETILKREIIPLELPKRMQAGMLRIFGEALDAETAVTRILTDIRSNGNSALQKWSSKIDNYTGPLQIDKAAMNAAAARLDPALLTDLKTAAARIRAFHSRQPLPSWSTNEMGGMLGQKMTALDRVGVYVPGGSAPLPSSLLMCAIPARVAGVPEVVAATPPGKDGKVPDIILAAAAIAQIDTLYVMGGAQAIAALAFGTESIPRVDKIVGAGNLFVTLAKRQLFGFVGLDGLFGPTETVVVADDSADPEWVAADLLAQAEHDLLASAILFTPSVQLAKAVQAAVTRQTAERSRAETITISLAGQGGIVLTADLAEAVALADQYAPEHLCLAVEDLARWEPEIRHAGGLFLGERSFEVLGDYVAGPSHIMPTGGTARFASPLNALDFVRITSLIQLDDATAARLSPTAARLAAAESLDAHANAALIRLAGTENEPAAAAQPRFDRFIRPSIAAMKPYTPIVPFEVLSRQLGRPPEALIKLDANENPYGPSPKAKAALASGQWLNIYPDPESILLREALADFTGAPFANLLAGAGADELIDLLLRAIIEPGDVVFNAPPSFGMYPFSTAVNAGRLVEIPRNEDFSFDIAGLETAVRNEPRARVLFVCSPNNPNGSLINDTDLKRLLGLPVLIVLDEAYIEFADQESRIQWVSQYPNLVILRTFSKWAGLAGLRIGYGAFPQWLITQLWKIKQPYNVNVAAGQAAIAALADQEWLQDKVLKIKAERNRLFKALQSIPYLAPLPSAANYILCRVDGRSAAELKQLLAEKEGILIRYFNTPLLKNFVRISIGTPEQSERLLAVLQSAALLPQRS